MSKLECVWVGVLLVPTLELREIVAGVSTGGGRVSKLVWVGGTHITFCRLLSSAWML